MHYLCFVPGLRVFGNKQVTLSLTSQFWWFILLIYPFTSVHIVPCIILKPYIAMFKRTYKTIFLNLLANSSSLLVRHRRVRSCKFTDLYLTIIIVLTIRLSSNNLIVGLYGDSGYYYYGGSFGSNIPSCLAGTSSSLLIRASPLNFLSLISSANISWLFCPRPSLSEPYYLILDSRYILTYFEFRGRNSL